MYICFFIVYADLNRNNALFYIFTGKLDRINGQKMSTKVMKMIHVQHILEQMIQSKS